MSEEQTTIYISPEDDLTNVRERLEQISTRRVILVIPNQTQLRSHVAWKLLRARARELGKEIFIISTDPQIRSVAQAVKFRVATSLESAPSSAAPSKARPSGRPVRSNPANRGRGTPASRPVMGKGPAELRGMSVRRSRPLEQENQWPVESTERPVTPNYPESRQSRSSEANTGGLGSRPSSNFGSPSRQFSKPYDFRIDTTPPIRPLSPSQMDEEPDLLLEDFNQARNIRKAAQQPYDQNATSAMPDLDQPSQSEHRYDIRPLPPSADDPFAYMDDDLPPPKSEQRASAPLLGFDTHEHAIQDVPDMPTDVIGGQIEDQGDQGDFVIHSNVQPKIRPWSEPAPEDDQDTAGPSRVYGVRPRSSRTGKVPTSPSRHDLDSEDALPHVEERATMPPPVPPTARPAASMGTRPRDSRSLQMPNATGVRPSAGQQSTQGPRSGARSRAALSKPLAKPAAKPATRQAKTRPMPAPAAAKSPAKRRRFGGYGLLIAIILISLVVGAIAYFGPAATVTITLPARDFSSPVKLQAKAGSTSGESIVPSETLSHQFFMNGNAKATGKTKVGTATASGRVVFTNNGSQQVIIPSKTIISTASGVQFVTQAEAAVLPKGSTVGNTLPVPVQAQQSGDSGNVPAQSITTLPAASKTAIAQYNNIQVADLNLLVTNDEATTGGGVGNATSITQKDLDTAKTTLAAQLQNDVDAWLKQQTQSGDVLGKTLTSDTLLNAPKAGQIVDNEAVPVRVQRSISVLIVRSAALQKATIDQLNTALRGKKSYENYAIVSDTTQRPVTIGQVKKTTTDDSITMNFTATGKIAPNISRDQVQKLVAGKSVQDAQTSLKNSIRDVQQIEIQPSPSFISWVPFWTGHIDVRIVAGLEPATPKAPAK